MYCLLAILSYLRIIKLVVHTVPSIFYSWKFYSISMCNRQHNVLVLTGIANKWLTITNLTSDIAIAIRKKQAKPKDFLEVTFYTFSDFLYWNIIVVLELEYLRGDGFPRSDFQR